MGRATRWISNNRRGRGRRLRGLRQQLVQSVCRCPLTKSSLNRLPFAVFNTVIDSSIEVASFIEREDHLGRDGRFKSHCTRPALPPFLGCTRSRPRTTEVPIGPHVGRQSPSTLPHTVVNTRRLVHHAGADDGGRWVYVGGRGRILCGVFCDGIHLVMVGAPPTYDGQGTGGA